MIHSEAKDFPDAKFDFYTDAVPFQGLFQYQYKNQKDISALDMSFLFHALFLLFIGRYL